MAGAEHLVRHLEAQAATGRPRSGGVVQILPRSRRAAPHLCTRSRYGRVAAKQQRGRSVPGLPRLEQVSCCRRAVNGSLNQICAETPLPSRSILPVTSTNSSRRSRAADPFPAHTHAKASCQLRQGSLVQIEGLKQLAPRFTRTRSRHNNLGRASPPAYAFAERCFSRAGCIF